MITNSATGTNLVEIAAVTYRINAPLSLPDGRGFSFNQCVIIDDAPMIFHSDVLVDGADLELGGHRLRWFDTPHVRHAWECGSMFDSVTRTLFCGDWYTQPGLGERALTDDDILDPREAFRSAIDYYAPAPQTQKTLERLAQERPTTLACMHGSAWHGDGTALRRERATSLRGSQTA
jgi:flavorubredoxin